MADERTHKRVAESNETMLKRLLIPDIAEGEPLPDDHHPWIFVVAYYTVSHMIERAVAVTDPDLHFLNHESQVDFLRSKDVLKGLAQLYDQMAAYKTYALLRATVNASAITERNALWYDKPEDCKSILLDGWVESFRTALESYCRSVTSI